MKLRQQAGRVVHVIQTAKLTSKTGPHHQIGDEREKGHRDPEGFSTQEQRGRAESFPGEFRKASFELELGKTGRSIKRPIEGISGSHTGNQTGDCVGSREMDQI